jgi:hypothetical protein
MRELTEYEKEKWLDFGYFEAPEFLMNGDELGEAYNALARVVNYSDYLSEKIVDAAIVEILDMYYYQMHIYTGLYGDVGEPEDFGLPTQEAFELKIIETFRNAGITEEQASGEELIDIPESMGDLHKKAWDWAMEWREEHLEETLRQKELEFHQKRVKELEC